MRAEPLASPPRSHPILTRSTLFDLSRDCQHGAFVGSGTLNKVVEIRLIRSIHVHVNVLVGCCWCCSCCCCLLAGQLFPNVVQPTTPTIKKDRNVHARTMFTRPQAAFTRCRVSAPRACVPCPIEEVVYCSLLHCTATLLFFSSSVVVVVVVVVVVDVVVAVVGGGAHSWLSWLVEAVPAVVQVLPVTATSTRRSAGCKGQKRPTGRTTPR